MPFWYYFPVPKLPPEISHQSNIVEIRKHLAPEGSTVDVGTPIAIVENYWAVMTLKANGKGILKKTVARKVWESDSGLRRCTFPGNRVIASNSWVQFPTFPPALRGGRRGLGTLPTRTGKLRSWHFHK
jgi:hypothetical protein